MRIFWLALVFVSFTSLAHQATEVGDSTAHYLGNEAVLVHSGSHKVLFDPFFHNDFGIYQRVPKALRQAVFDAEPPYDGVSLVVISHAHEDHFSARDVLRYLTQHNQIHLIAPQQAIDTLNALSGSDAIADRVHSIKLAFGDPAWSSEVEGVTVEAVRIPHAGWPGRADVENLVFRLTFAEQSTVMHLGDADPQIEHYLPYRSYWDLRNTQLGFPPYWFFGSAEGRDILDTYLHVEHAVGVHVPVKVPKLLKKIGRDYFSEPGETRNF